MKQGEIYAIFIQYNNGQKSCIKNTPKLVFYIIKHIA
jgi:hypothetical protein